MAVEVPKFTARPSDTTPAAGQRFSFKAPAGALSLAQTTQGDALGRLADDAARLGAVVMQLHRNDIAAKAIATMSGEIDAAVATAQQQDIADPRYENEGGGMLGHFNERVSAIFDRLPEHTGDPLTQRQIREAIGARVAAARTTVTRANTSRLIDIGRATLNEGRSIHIRDAAAELPLGWDGNENTLPASVLTIIDREEAAQNSAAAIGLITAVKAGENIHKFRGDIAKYAVDAQNNAAQTTDQVFQLMDLLDDPEKFFWLKPTDRERLKKNLLNKHNRLLTAELQQETRSRVAARAELKERQAIRLSTLVDKVFSARKGVVDSTGASVMPTQEEILDLASLDGALGLAAGKVTMLMNMIDDKGVKQSDPEFVADLYAEVYAIINNPGLSQEERRRGVSIQIDRSDGQVAKRFGSLVTIEDHLTFTKWAHTVSDEEVISGEIADNLRLVEGSAVPLDDFGMYENRDDVYHVIRARGVYFQGLARGMTPPEAAKRALNAVGVTMGDDDNPFAIGRAPFYPPDLPRNFTITIDQVPGSFTQADDKRTSLTTFAVEAHQEEVTMPKVEEWTKEHVAHARAYAEAQMATLDAAGFVELLEQIDAIEAYVRSK
jgi:hypothetical protein